MIHSFSFDETQFNRLFPFYILINWDLKVIAFGKSIRKLYDFNNKESFNQLFSIPRPLTPIEKFDDLIALENQLVVIELVTKKLLLRGQFEFLKDSNEILFVGSPWFGSMEQVIENQLVIDDFARHDPLIDLLHVLKSQEITNEDLKELITTINRQKNELKKAAKEVHEIALFPTQNPDPLIRINFDGELLRNNPAAASLDFFDFENKTYRNDEFFQLIATRIDTKNPRWIIEAHSDNRDYSFVCVSMKEEGYINIYGRDTTQQKIDQLTLERLALVASANENGVLFTTPEGNITWANDGFCKLTGYTLEEVIGKSPIELFKGPLSDKTTLYNIMESFFKGDGFSSEVLYYRKDKTCFWGRSASQPIKNADGKVTEFFGIIQNVTEEKASQERLKVLSQIAEDNINAVVIADQQGKITWINKSFIEMTGYTLEEAIGRKPGELLQGPETDKSTIEYLRKQIKNGDPFSTEIINYSKAGNKYWLRIQGQAIKNEKGDIVGFFALEQDITKEKESENLFRQALENIGDNVWEHNFKTGMTYFSKSENEFFDNADNEITNNQKLWWNSLYKEDLNLLIENDKEYRSGKRNSHNLEYRIVLKDGTTRWILDRGVVIEKDRVGKPIRITGTHTNITERKNIEERLEKQRQFYEDILNNMPADIAVFSAKHEYLFVNPMGIKDEELRKWIIGKRDEDYCEFRNKPMSIAAGRRETFNKVIASKNPSEWEEKNIAPNGEEKYVLRRWYPLIENDNKVKLVIGYGIDITERKKMEHALIKSREQAEQLTKAKENFLANMSHEIRTPMNAIMGMTNQLFKTSLSEKQNFYLETIQIASENLLVIINDILDVAKIEAGKLSVEKIAFEPKKVLGNVMQVMLHKAEEKGLSFTNSNCDVMLSQVLLGDPYRLNQILLNLVSNAIKFTEKGEVDISCEIVNYTQTTQNVKISVKDTGVGMDESFSNLFLKNSSKRTIQFHENLEELVLA